MSLAVAYAMKRKAKHKANGGEMCAHGKDMDDCSEHHEGEMMAEGGPSNEYSAEVLSPLNAVIKHRGKWIDTVNPKNVESAIEHHKKKNMGSHEEHMAEGGMMSDDSMDTPNTDDDDLANNDDDSDGHDMVGRIMKQRQAYSEGGRVANETHETADLEENEFDDLAKEDGLEEHYTGANSGDEIGDHQEDMDRDDMISRIMMSRRKKDRNPRPA